MTIVSQKSWLVCPDVCASLETVESELLKSISHNDHFIAEVCSHLVTAGGKKIRPALLLLSAQFGNAHNPHEIPSAVALELLHIASLYHDDVVDQAAIRRHIPSANAKWGNRLATFAGSCLLSIATRLLADAGDTINQMVSATLAKLWNGQAREFERSFNLDMDEEVYFKTIEEKTASICELACKLGAHLGDVPKLWADCLAEYGRNLGIAFQLTDDVIDLVADEGRSGKLPGSDLRHGCYTLLVIYSLIAGDEYAKTLRKILANGRLTDRDLDSVKAILRCNGSIPRTMGVARSFIKKAQQALDGVPGGNAKDSLLLLGNFVVDQITSDEQGWQ